MEESKRPLVVDLDGTLVQTDLLVESSIGFLRSNLLRFFQLLFWLVGGKACLKQQLAKHYSLDAATLPYNAEVLALIGEARVQGRKIILATASDKTYAQQVADHLGVFDDVLATDGDINLSRKHKKSKLIQLYGEKCFDYVGNAHADITVWQAADKAIIVEPHFGVVRKANHHADVVKVIKSSKSKILTWLKAMRLHQWLKNLLLFIPLLASHQITLENVFVVGPLAFLFFGLCASSVYLLNDIIDIQDDRAHSTKCKRPFASGQLSILSGLFIIPLLLVITFAGAYFYLPVKFVLALSCYYIITLLYSLYFKRIVVLDVITLGALYTLRIIAGAFAFGLVLTFWMLAFSMFIFLSLALVKRYSELLNAKQSGKQGKAKGRGYFTDDLEMISALGAAAGYISVMVLALYIQDTTTIQLYSYPQLIWLSCPVLLFWVSRIWVLAHRGLMHEDPVVFAAKDRTSLIAGLLFLLIFWGAV